jgi:hypothetical protein
MEGRGPNLGQLCCEGLGKVPAGLHQSPAVLCLVPIFFTVVVPKALPQHLLYINGDQDQVHTLGTNPLMRLWVGVFALLSPHTSPVQMS